MLYEHQFRAMNTGIGVWVWSPDPERTAGDPSCDTVGPRNFFAGVEAELSRFRDTSALSRLNGAAGRGPQGGSSRISCCGDR
jgi:hypothetical protein